MATSETVGDKIRRLVRNLPVDKKTKRTARIIAFRALRERKEKLIQDRLNGHFDFEEETDERFSGKPGNQEVSGEVGQATPKG